MIDAQFDSDILIDALNGVEAARAEIRRAGRNSISRISWTEVMTAADPTSVKAVEAFLGCFAVEEVGDAAARRAAADEMDLRAANLQLGKARDLASGFNNMAEAAGIKGRLRVVNGGRA